MDRTITQRDFRNSSATVMDAVENGETIVITRNGTPVAELRPFRRRQFVPTADVIGAIHGLGWPNYAAMRAEADVLFGEGRAPERVIVVDTGLGSADGPLLARSTAEPGLGRRISGRWDA